MQTLVGARNFSTHPLTHRCRAHRALVVCPAGAPCAISRFGACRPTHSPDALQALPCLVSYARLLPQVFEILLSRGYSENNFRDDLKNLYMKLGLENKMMIFLFTDAHVAEEGFLELINNMLTSGTARSLAAPPPGRDVPSSATSV